MGIDFVRAAATEITVVEDLPAEVKQNLSPSSVDTTRLADGEFVGFRVSVPADKVLRCWTAGAINTSDASPTDLKAVIGNTVVANGSARETGEPLYESSSGVTLLLATQNDTGGEQDASSYFSFTIENA